MSSKEKVHFKPAIEIFPSLHHMVHATEGDSKAPADISECGTKTFGIPGLDDIIPKKDNEVYMQKMYDAISAINDCSIEQVNEIRNWLNEGVVE